MRRLAPIIVFAIAFTVFAPAIRYGWVPAWDDGEGLISNPLIRIWFWKWIALGIPSGHWMPLSSLVATVEYHLWGYQPAPWHAVNVALHALNALLVFLIAHRLLRSTPGAVISALIFAVHPQRIEAVAWITEIRMVMMAAFFLGSALLWLNDHRWWALLAFVLACLSHPLAVWLPVMLLLLEWCRYEAAGWQHRLTLVRSLVPFFVVSLITGLIGIRAVASLHNAIAWSQVGLVPRLLHVAYSEAYYAGQMLVPSRLSHLIEYTWAPSMSQPQYPLALAALAIVGVILGATVRRWPTITAACLAYTVVILPEAGFIPMGPQLVANRYSYLATVPFALLVGALVALAVQRWPRLTWSVSVAGLATLVVVTSLAMPMWRDSDTLWMYAARHEPTCTWCQDMAAAIAYRNRDLDEARRRLEQAIAVSDTTAYPRWERHWNLAGILLEMNKRDEAVVELRRYLATVPIDRRDSPVDHAHIVSARRMLESLGKGGG